MTTSSYPTKSYVQTSIYRAAHSLPVRHSISFSGPGRTRQEFKDECDINRILKTYKATGILPPPANTREPIWGELEVGDFQSAMDIVAEARTQFEGLASTIRNRFDNDPAKLLAFVENPFNRAEAHSLGLLRGDYQPLPADAPTAILEPSSPIPFNPSPAPTPKT